MPNDRKQSDLQLSELLAQAEPPKSPEHLDDLILNYARDNVPESAAKSSWSFLSASGYWLNQHWVSALTTVSVAAIAVSVSIQLLTTDQQNQSYSGLELADIQQQSISQSPAVAPAPQRLPTEADMLAEEPAIEAEKIGTPISLAVAESRERIEAASSTLVEAPQPARQNASNVAIRSEIESLDADLTANEPGPDSPVALAAAGSTRVQASRPAARSANNAPPALESQAGAVQNEIAAAPAILQDANNNATDQALEEVEEVIVTGANIRRSEGFTQASALIQIAPDLTTTLQASATARDQYLTFLYGVLLSFDETDGDSNVTITYQPETVRQLIDAFTEIPDIPSMVSAENRYNQAREEFTEFELPENLPSAIGLLQNLQNMQQTNGQ